MAKKIKCPSCGLKSGAGTKFCSECGRRLTAKPLRNDSLPAKAHGGTHKLLNVLAIGFASVVAVMLTALFAIAFLLLELSHIAG